jgi:hypothetical protein
MDSFYKKDSEHTCVQLSEKNATWKDVLCMIGIFLEIYLITVLMFAM